MSQSSDRPPAAPYAEDELVVATVHKHLVLQELNKAGVPYADWEDAPDLGLSRLLRLDSEAIAQQFEVLAAEEALEAAESGTAATSGTAHTLGPLPPARPMEPLEKVLHHLRTRFASRYGGWWPTIGKNRRMDHVHGAWDTIPGGGTSPASAKGASFPDLEQIAGGGVRVAVVDTRLSPHRWLTGRCIGTRDGLLDAAAVNAAFGATENWMIGHATFIAGLVLRQAPGALVELYRGLDDHGKADSWSVAKAIAAAGRSMPDVINLSLGCYTDDGQPPLVLATALAKLPPETVVVAAAGNDPGVPVRPMWPAAFEEVIAVGAVDRDGVRPDWSPGAPWVDVSAEGVDVLSTYPEHQGEDWKRWSGTSFAAAKVSGAIARAARPQGVNGRAEPGACRRVVTEMLKTAPRDRDGRPWLGGAS